MLSRYSSEQNITLSDKIGLPFFFAIVWINFFSWVRDFSAVTGSRKNNCTSFIIDNKITRIPMNRSSFAVLIVVYEKEAF
jgi:hypothetical protein